MSTTDLDTGEVLDQLLTDGYVVERHLDASTTADLRDRVQGCSSTSAPTRSTPGPGASTPARRCAADGAEDRAGCVSPDRGGPR